MSEQITMPQLNDIGEDSGTIDEVLVGVGDEVKQGQTVLTVEMEKSVVDIESPYAGKVAKVNVSKGDEVELGQVLIELE